MTYSLPFGLKQKPLPHYFENGVVRFYIREGELHFLIRKITKTSWATILKGKVKDEAQLSKLINFKSFDEIPTIEVVN